MKRNEFLGAMCLFIFGLLTTILSMRMPIGNFRAAGTGLFPFFLGILLMILSLIYMLKIFLTKNVRETEEKDTFSGESVKKQVVLFLIVVGVTVFLLERIGFLLFSFLLMVGLMYVLGVKRVIFNLVFSAGTAIFSYMLFVRWLKIPLPRGFLWF